jgi:hypothetical protein
MTGRRGFHPWDVLPALWLVDRAPFRTERRGVRLATRPGWRGRIRYEIGEIEVVTEVDADAFVRRWRSLV